MEQTARFDHNGVPVSAYSDSDTSKDARGERRRHFEGLCRLPFWTLEQIVRLETLKTLCVLDNHAAMNEARR
jgi:hypothetical protein